MDLSRLRQAIEDALLPHLKRKTHKELPGECVRFGLPAPPPDEFGSRADRVDDAWSRLNDEDLSRVGQLTLEQALVREDEARRTLEDLLWQDLGPRIPKRYRRELADAFEEENYHAGDLFGRHQPFLDLVERLFLDRGTITFIAPDPRKADIERHVIRNRRDWPVDHFFENLGVYDCVDYRFVQFLEGLASAELTPNVEALELFTKIANSALKPCRVEFRQIDEQEGYPVFRLFSSDAGVTGRPKNVIFGGPKPELRLKDAVNNDIEIVKGADRVLIFDRPIPADGLKWTDLVVWYADLQRRPIDRDLRRSLYARLRDGVPASSPGQYAVFTEFYALFAGRVDSLPALLPEVWLHWDPKSVRARGADRLPRFRMDFLVLFSHSERVVIEVDGRHHYSEEVDGTHVARPSKYAEMVRADRDLRLAGYEVYRFGSKELEGEAGKSLVREFFQALYRKHGRL